MNEIVVAIGPDHTLRDAARRMTERGVGAAVVMDPDRPGPCIITERDLLRSSGRGEDVDREVVRDHLTQDLVLRRGRLVARRRRRAHGARRVSPRHRH